MADKSSSAASIAGEGKGGDGIKLKKKKARNVLSLRPSLSNPYIEEEDKELARLEKLLGINSGNLRSYCIYVCVFSSIDSLCMPISISCSAKDKRKSAAKLSQEYAKFEVSVDIYIYIYIYISAYVCSEAERLIMSTIPVLLC